MLMLGLVIWAILEMSFYFHQKWSLVTVNDVKARHFSMNHKFRSRQATMEKIGSIINGTKTFMGEKSFPGARNLKEYVEG